MRFLAWAVVAWALAAAPAWAADRVALVIGNGDYADDRDDLKNPANDAADMTAAVSFSGFAALAVLVSAISSSQHRQIKRTDH